MENKKNTKNIYLYGKHALVEALENKPEAVKKIFLSPNVNDETISNLIKKTGVSVAVMSDKEAKTAEGGVSHQGVIAKISPENLVLSYENFISKLEVGKDTSLVLLSGLEDPHNVGAIIRSAAAFGVSGVLLPTKNQAPITGTVIKVSAGMVFRMPIISIESVDGAIKDLKQRGFKVYGMEGESKNSVINESFIAPSVFVMGNESHGIEKETLRLCDEAISIPMNPKCESLNVAASAAIVLYAWSLKHDSALR